MPRPGNKTPSRNIDITLTGIGEDVTPAAPAAPVKGSKIDIPLGGAAPKKPENADLTDTEFAFVNRHHDEVKAQRRAARKQGK